MGLLNQILVNSLYRFIFIVFQFLVTIFVSRLIGPDGLGLYSLLLANANIILIFTSLGIPSGIIFHTAKKDLAKNSLWSIAFISALAQFALVGIVEFIHWKLWGRFLIWPSDEPIKGALGLLFFFSLLITERYAAFYTGSNRLKWYSMQQAVISFLVIISLAYWRFFGIQPSSYQVILLLIISSILQMVTTAIVFTRIGSLQLQENTLPQNKSSFFNYSMLAWVANSIQFLVYRIDFWILHYFHGDNELGLYALSVRIGQTFWIIPALLSTIILPNMTSASFEPKTMERIIRLSNTVNLVIAIAIVVLSPGLLPLVFGQEFSGSIVPLMIILPGVLFVSMHTLLAAYFAAKDKVKYNLQASILALVSITLLDFLLIPSMGRTGAALASTIAYSVSSMYALMLYCKMEGYSIHRIILERSDLQWLEMRISGLLSSNRKS